MLKAQLAHGQNELHISELAREITGIVHQNLEEIDLHQLEEMED